MNHKVIMSTIYVLFSDEQNEKKEQLEFELLEERGKRTEIETQLSDFIRYVGKLKLY